MHLLCTFYATQPYASHLTPLSSPKSPRPSSSLQAGGGGSGLKAIRNAHKLSKLAQARYLVITPIHARIGAHFTPHPPPPCTFSRLSRSRSPSPYLPLRHPFTPLHPYSLAVGRSCGSLHGDATSLLAPAATTHRPLGGTAESEAGEGGREGGAQRRCGQGGTHPAGGLQPRIAA